MKKSWYLTSFSNDIEHCVKLNAFSIFWSSTSYKSVKRVVVHHPKDKYRLKIDVWVDAESFRGIEEEWRGRNVCVSRVILHHREKSHLHSTQGVIFLSFLYLIEADLQKVSSSNLIQILNFIHIVVLLQGRNYEILLMSYFKPSILWMVCLIL